MLSRTNLRNLIILLGSTTTVLAATIISPALPGMAAAFSDVENVDFLVRLSLTMPALFIAIGALFAGVLLDRVGRKPVILVSLILYGVAGTAGFFMTSLFAILASRALLGLAVAGIMSGFTTLLLDYFQGGELNKFLGLQGAFIGTGGMLFLLLAGYLANFGWQYPFLVHLFAFLIVPGVYFTIEDTVRTAPQAVDGVGKLPFPWRKFLPVYATAFIGMVIFFIFPVQVPFYLAEEGGVGGSQIGFALSMQTFSSIFVSLAYKWMKGRYSFQKIFAIIFAAFSVGNLILGYSANFTIVTLSLLISGIGIGLLAPNNSGWLATMTPASIRGKAVGLLTSTIFVGQFFSPIITQPILSRFGLATMFFVSAAVAIGLAILFWVMGDERQ